MKVNESIMCPHCHHAQFTAKYEATYVYSYNIDTSNTSQSNSDDTPAPFLFDNREQKDFKQYIECNYCHAKYPCTFSLDSDQVNFTILQKAIRANHTENIEFWG